ncbi:signal protein [Streptomyces sp. NPDC004779]
MRFGFRGVLLAGLMAGGVVGCGAGTAADVPAAAAGTSVSPSSAPEPDPSFTPLRPDDLQSRWWSWAARETEESNPVTDRTGKNCAINQAWDVWFLAGSFGTRVSRTCAVPDDLPLAFPVVNTLGDERECATFMAEAEGSVVLDGKSVAVDRHQVMPVSVEGNAGNPATGVDGTLLTKGCGLWAQLPPLEAGRHTLEIRGRSGDFSLAVNYTLNVRAKAGKKA